MDDTIHAATPTPDAAQKRKRRKRKKVLKGLLIGLISAAALGAGVYGLVRLLGTEDAAGPEVMTAFVSRGAITSRVEGSGVAVAKDSASVSIPAAGSILEVFVSEGDRVAAGDRLYAAASPELESRLKSAQDALNDALEGVARAQQNRDEQARKVSRVYAELQKLNAEPRSRTATADYAGVLTDVARLRPGDSVSQGDALATLIDDSRYLLRLYFSYTYEDEISVGQSAQVSVPVLMSRLPGTVAEIHKVERISPEGSKLFEVLIEVPNPGTLTAEMEAGATLEGAEGELYPYEGGALEIYRSTKITAPMDGTVEAMDVYDYSRVSAGQAICTVRGAGRDAEIQTLREQLESEQAYLRDQEEAIVRANAQVAEAQAGVAQAQENLAGLDAVAPIGGTVLALGIAPGDEVTTGHVAVSIADTSTMVINASVDEMNVSSVRAGMDVEIDQWGQTALGVVESVSLSGEYENGVSRFPVVISVDNSENLLLPGSYVNYSFTASQSEDCLLAPVQCVKYVETEEGRQKAVFVRADTPPEDAAELLTDLAEIPEGFWPVLVETGISDSSNVELLSPWFEEGTELYQTQVRPDMNG
ncbi:MAG: HlyD family efflux transporter periplasmic adaptor subunit [Oscillospiraceae bacterium]|nr:HlyD family efflux transporter periplasmic adaptor subunit [Oscillospiraceae bacterium]